MRSLIIDERIRDFEFEYLSKFFNVIKLPVSSDVYEEISGHSDIFYSKYKGKIICAPNAIYKEDSFLLGNSIVEESYPFDVPYNVCEIGNLVVGSKYADSSMKVDVIVKQGYTKCSIAVTSDKSCITTDEGIYKKFIDLGIDALFIKEENIKLPVNDKLKKYSNKNGFIGGATLVFDNKFVLFGDSDKLANKEKIEKHLKKYNLELIEFKGYDIIDYGSGIEF